MSNAQKQPTCEERIDDRLASMLDTLAAMLEADREDPESYTDDGGNLSEWGLAFDYVEPGTFEDQREGYWRFQISYGGPSSEIRFYLSPGAHQPYRTEYWFLDWFDGAHRVVNDDEHLDELWCWLKPVWRRYIAI